ncbi:MAG: hypothetical protein EBZ49_07515 [Proteobacteria bacterium]|nr:hypothetical protein [Pseudomonadota bacterium]
MTLSFRRSLLVAFSLLVGFSGVSQGCGLLLPQSVCGGTGYGNSGYPTLGVVAYVPTSLLTGSCNSGSGISYPPVPFYTNNSQTPPYAFLYPGMGMSYPGYGGMGGTYPLTGGSSPVVITSGPVYVSNSGMGSHGGTCGTLVPSCGGLGLVNSPVTVGVPRPVCLQCGVARNLLRPISRARTLASERFY